jgi:hypothetical protein
MKKEKSAIRLARDEARARGEHTFTVNAPCRLGHISPRRYTSNGICVACVKARSTQRKLPDDALLRVANSDTLPVQFRQDKATRTLAAEVRGKLGAAAGRNVSGSVTYRAAIRLLAHYLTNRPAADLGALLRSSQRSP